MSNVTYETGMQIALDTKAITEDGSFEGYASRFGEVDLGRDAVQVGAFTKSLAARPAGRVKMLREHNRSEPVGIWTDIAEDGTGLRVKGRLILDTVKGRETYALMKAGALDTLSIGYRTKASRLDKTKGVRLLDEVELHEISIVTFGMLPTATVSSVKSNTPNTLRAIADVLNAARASMKG
ncbi:HK97 family phage prohead protease [Sinorhizobium medicae]|uniref:Primosomal replication protein N n=1 Tax=Sinorhizobium medicae TaxID=110321 RepID=A0ABX4TNR3_9HYPH|nr:HK97 family phage prohead protease [Sinorhizobium medicae]PLU03818.1 primosomal replication protein N [Sinorhizobium medicae]PLU17448.1 primosomal replication protein N [Sinorhizobium medicae]PLU77030.1 primosomal replication protein N [Sinorhizobium medicae]